MPSDLVPAALLSEATEAPSPGSLHSLELVEAEAALQLPARHLLAGLSPAQLDRSFLSDCSPASSSDREPSLSSGDRTLVLQKVPSEDDPEVRNHGKGPY